MYTTLSSIKQENCYVDIPYVVTPYISYKIVIWIIMKNAYSNVYENFTCKTENFQIKYSDIFHISAQNIVCGVSQSILFSR